MTNTETTMKLTGREAIAYAEANGLSLSKYADPIEDSRVGLSVEEANAVAREDASLIYVAIKRHGDL